VFYIVWMEAGHLPLHLSLNFSQNDLIINIPTKVRYTNQS